MKKFYLFLFLLLFSFFSYSQNQDPGLDFRIFDKNVRLGAASFIEPTISTSGGTITYTSTNPLVASVNPTTGKVTMLKAGTTVITATVAATGTYSSDSKRFFLIVIGEDPGLAFRTADKTVKLGAASFTEPATAASGGDITYTSDDTKVATVNPTTGKVTIVGVGEAYIIATVATNGTYRKASKRFLLKVGEDPGLTFRTANKYVKLGDAPFTEPATATSGGTITYTSSNPKLARVNPTTGEVTIVGAEALAITATVAATGTYSSASKMFLLTVTGEDPGLTFRADDKTVKMGDASFTVTATVTSGGAITYTSSNSLVAKVNPTTGTVTIVGAGVTEIRATVPTNGTYREASLYFLLTVTGEDPGLAFRTVDKTVKMGDASFTEPATATSPGDITYTSDDTRVATVNPTTGKVTIVGVGKAIIRATVAAIGTYRAASLYFLLSVTGEDPGLIFRTVDKTVELGDASFTEPATAASGGAITYTSSNSLVAKVNPTTGTVTIVGVGHTYIRATVAAVGTYRAAWLDFMLTVTGEDPGLTFRTADKIVKLGDAPFTEPATATSRGVITYESTNERVATVDTDGLITIVGAGETVIRATVAAVGTYSSDWKSFLLDVTGEDPSLTFRTAEKTVKMGDASFTEPATATSQGDITYISSEPLVARVDTDGLVTIVGAGVTAIRATVAAVGTYRAASLGFTLFVTGEDPGLTFRTADKTVKLGAAPFTEPAATATSPGTITYSSDNTKVATVNPTTGKVTIVGVGGTYIRATVAAIGTYRAASFGFTLSVTGEDPGLTFRTAQKNVKLGAASFTEPATAASQGDITYESGNERVATVNPTTGTVTIVGVGETYITATVAASGVYPEAWKSFLLKVGEDPGLAFREIPKTVELGDASFQQKATATSQGTITYTSDDTKVATVDPNSGTVTIVRVGYTYITASVAATGTYRAASKRFPLSVIGDDPGLTFWGDPKTVKMGDASFQQKATATSRGVITYESTNERVATVNPNSGTVTIVGVGDAYITASVAATGNYRAASKRFLLKVGEDPGLTFRTADKTVKMGDASFTEPATATSRGDITYRSGDERVAKVNPTTGTVTIVGMGDAYIIATVAAIGTYREVSKSFLLKVGEDPDLTFWENPKEVEIGDASFQQRAAATSPGDITYTSSEPLVATVNPNGLVTIVKAGQTVITATIAASGVYAKASKSFTLTVGKKNPRITFSSDVAEKTYASNQPPFPSLALDISPAGLTITYSSDDKRVATVNATTGKITMLKAGVAVIRATSAESDQYKSTTATYTLTIKKADATLTFSSATQEKPYGEPPFAALVPTTGPTAGLPVIYVSGNTDVATVTSSGTITILKAGQAVITATLDGNYKPVSATYTLTVKKVDASLTFSSATQEKPYGEPPFAALVPTTTPTAGLPVIYVSGNTDVATVTSSGTITILKAGQAVITATLDGNYKPATATYILTVKKADPTLAFSSDTQVKPYNPTPFTALVLTNPTSLPVTYVSSVIGVATIDPNSGTVTMLKAGQTVITATSAENDQYNAKSVTYTLTVEKADAKITFDSETVSKNVGVPDFNMGVTRVPTVLPLTYESSAEGVAKVGADTGIVTVEGIGTTVIKASFVGNDKYKAVSATYTLTVNTKIDPVITFQDTDMTKVYGTVTSFNIDLATSTSEGATITYTSSAEGVATVTSEDKFVTIVIKGAGTTRITAISGEKGNYNSGQKSFTLNVEKGNVKIAFAVPTMTKQVGDPVFTVIATTTPTGLPVTYVSSVIGVATVDTGGEVKILKAGQTVITASFAGNANYNAATATYTLMVEKGNPTLAFSSDTQVKPYGETPFAALVLTNPTGLPLTYESNNLNVATVNRDRGIVTIVGVGKTVITASFAGNDQYNAATATYTLTVEKAFPEITFPSDDMTKTFGDVAFTVTATANSGGDITYESSNSLVATIVESTGEITIVGAGETVITATSAENDKYNAATATYTLTVNKGNPILTFSPATVGKTYEDPPFTHPLTTDPTTGLSVTYESSNLSVATIVESTGEITIVGAGETVITATSAENDKYNSATATYTLTIEKADPTLAFSSDTQVKPYGETPFAALVLTNPTSLPVTYVSSAEGVAKVGADTGIVTMLKAGQTVITATSAENNQYNAKSVTYTLTVEKASPTLTFDSETVSKNVDVPDFNMGVTRVPTVLPLTYESSAEVVAKVGADTGIVTVEGIGTTVIKASFAGNDKYKAVSATYTLTVNTKIDPVITFQDTDMTKVYDTVTSFNIDLATSTSEGATITYTSSAEGVATVTSEDKFVTIVIKGAGTTRITAISGEKGNYNSGQKSFTLNVEKGNVKIAFAVPTMTKQVGDPVFTVIATTTPTGLPVTYVSGNTDMATVNRDTGIVTIVGVGKTVITASFAGNANYNAATATYTLTVNNKADASLTFAVPTMTKQVGDPVFTVIATTTPTGLPVTYESSVEGVAKVGTDTGEVTIIREGRAVITASFAGNANYNAATSTFLLTVVNLNKKTFTIEVKDMKKSFGSLPFRVGKVTKPEVTGLSFVYKSSDEKVAKIDDTGRVTLVGVGTTTVEISFAGNGEYSPSTSTFLLEVEKGEVRLSIEESKVTKRYGEASFSLDVTVDPYTYAGLSYRSSDESVATVDSMGEVTLNGLGSSTITVLATDTNYNPVSITLEIEVLKGIPVIDFPFVFSKPKGSASFELQASVTPSSVGTITYSSNPVVSEVVSVSVEGTVTMKEVGTVELIASIEGTDKYESAQATITFRVTGTELQDIVYFTELKNSYEVGSTVTLTATSSVETLKEFIYLVEEGNAKIEGNILTFTSPGEVSVIVRQDGDDIYQGTNTEILAIQTTMVERGVPKIDITSVGDRKYGDIFLLELKALYGVLDVRDKLIYQSSDEDVLRVRKDGKATIVGVGTGTVELTVKMEESAYSFATSVTQTFRITKADIDFIFGDIPAKRLEDVAFKLDVKVGSLLGFGVIPIEYSSSDEGIATVDGEGLVTIVTAGSVDMVARIEGTDYYKAVVATRTLVVSAVSSVDVLGAVLSEVLLYPNPTEGDLVLEIEDGYMGKVQVGVYSMSGKLLIASHLDKSEDRISYHLDVRGLGEGIYFVKVVMGSSVSSHRFLKR